MSAAQAAILPANPFPGLRSFGADEEHLFFGRENQVDAMVNKLADTRFLAVVGTSGSGKSSLVNCGLRPALRQGLMARADTAWRMVQFRPGTDPIGAMARALAQDGVLFREHTAAGMTLAEIIETTLRFSRLGLIDICERAALDEGVNLLVVVDQFEELFRYRPLGAAGREGDQRFGEEATAFVKLLLEVKERATCPIFVVLTMRSDFLGDCTQFPGLAEAINAGQYLVPQMTRDERRDAIVGPVGVGGAEIAPILLTQLVNDVGDNPDQLSILQHALNRTWARWQNEGGGKGPLDLAHYEAIGTMVRALDQHAEQAYAELGTPRQQQISEKLFKALTDRATDPRGVRRPTTLGKLCILADATAAEVTDVIDVFRKPSRSFLVPPAADALEVETVIDISHESLMRVWERLIKWLDEETGSARTYYRLADTAALHAAGNANLWRDPELQAALDWCEKSQPNETWASRYHPGFAAAMRFLTDSSEAGVAERAEREQQRQRLLEAEQEKAQAQARYAQRMRWAAVFCGALAVVAMGFGVTAHNASRVAEMQKAEAQASSSDLQIMQSRMLVEAAKKYPVDQPMRILLALEALPDAKEKIDRPVVLEAQTILSEGIDALHPSPQQHQFNTPETRQALIELGKAVVPRCLTIAQRRDLLLRPSPPGWCIDMGKSPYDTKHWKAWKVGKTTDSVDPPTAVTYGNFADVALKAGDFKIALEAAELGIIFGPEKIWIRGNRAHALMFLGRTQEARDVYLKHRGVTINQGPWEDAIVHDFQLLREMGREHPLMTEIEQLFKPSLPVK